MSRLYIEDDDGNVQVVPIESDELTIGRADDNDIVLAGRNISRHHVGISREGKGYRVADAGSRYGFKINGAMVQEPRAVSPGDVIEIGDYKLKVLAREDAAIADAVSPEAPTIDETPDQRETVTDRPAVADSVDSEAPTRVNAVLEMEEVASAGMEDHPADVFPEDEEMIPGRTAGSGGRPLLMASLVALAIVLGLVYYWISGEPASPPRIDKTTVEAPGPSSERPSVPERAVEVGKPALKDTAPGPAEIAPAPKKIVAPPPSKKPAKKVERKVKKKASKKPAHVTAKARTARHPKASVTHKTDAYAAIDAAIGDYRAADAEKLLRQCKGAGCFKRWKKVARMYEGFGDSAKAIKVYRRLIGMTRDPTSKERFRKQIIALGGTPD